MLRLITFSLLSFLAAWPAQAASANAPEEDDPSFTISVDQPTYVGGPIWVRASRLPKGIPNGGSTCNRLELLFRSKSVEQWAFNNADSGAMWSGSGTGPIDPSLDCGFSILKNLRGNHLQLLVWYPVRLPGTYAVRWVTETSYAKDGKRAVKYIHSAWSTFVVSPIAIQEREQDLTHLVAELARDRDLLISNYVPSLIGYAPDERALNAAVGLLYSRNDYIAEEAQEVLLYFPREGVRTSIIDSVRRRGTTGVIHRMCQIGLFGLDPQAFQAIQR